MSPWDVLFAFVSSAGLNSSQAGPSCSFLADQRLALPHRLHTCGARGGGVRFSLLLFNPPNPLYHLKAMGPSVTMTPTKPPWITHGCGCSTSLPRTVLGLIFKNNRKRFPQGLNRTISSVNLLWHNGTVLSMYEEFRESPSQSMQDFITRRRTAGITWWCGPC